MGIEGDKYGRKEENKTKFKNSNSACNYFYYNNGWIYNNDDKYKQETISK